MEIGGGKYHTNCCNDVNVHFGRFDLIESDKMRFVFVLEANRRRQQLKIHSPCLVDYDARWEGTILS